MECPVATTSFSAFRATIESAALQAVADHWEEARSSGRMPSWSDLNPSRIAPHLTRVWSFKYDRATREFTARLAGNRITVGFGISFRGTPLRDIHPPHIFEQVHARLTRLVDEPCLYRSSGKLFRQDEHVTEGERIVLPLASDGESADGALGASDFTMPPHNIRQRQVEIIYDIEQWFTLAD
jgi:hypothetical protein